ncbi:MAG TPA: Rad52/Rad22 family DNA repair protein [Gammaproteobacteria bacterium]|nr:Rad52/Rad22 family DNA repair protein [Gammaproteobacteria bacterium]
MQNENIELKQELERFVEGDKSMFTAELYRQLLVAVEALPPEAIERSSAEKTRKGYDTTGYQYQYLVNVLNEVVGVAHWSFDYKINKELVGQWKTGDYYEITVELVLNICNVERKCVGGHKSGAHADALKGAITNAFKKTAALFGVGKSAYEGTIDDDYMPVGVVMPAPVGEYYAPMPSEPPMETIMTNVPVANKPRAFQQERKICPTCKQQHSGKYPVCYTCYMAKQ